QPTSDKSGFGNILQYFTGRKRSVKRPVRNNSSSALVDYQTYHRGMTGLNERDRPCRGQVGGVADVRDLAQVGVYASVLQDEGGLLELSLVLGYTLKVKARFAHRGATQSFLEKRHVSVLILGHCFQENLGLWVTDCA